MSLTKKLNNTCNVKRLISTLIFPLTSFVLGSRHMGDLAGFYEGNPRTRVESTSTKEKPKVAPRRGSESNKALETPAEITADSDRSGTPKTGPFFTRTRAQSLQSPAFLDKGAEIPIIGPLTLSETEYSHIHPEKRHTTRRLTQPSVSETSKLDASWLEDLTSKMAARNTAKSAAPVSDSGEPGISQTGSSYSWAFRNEKVGKR